MTTDNITSTEHEAITELREHLRKIALIQHASTILSWDQETHMPSSGGAVRAEALGELAGISHKRAQDPALGESIERAEEHRAVFYQKRSPFLEADCAENKLTRGADDIIERCSATNEKNDTGN